MMIQMPTATRATPFASAARISARRQPKLIRVGGRPAREPDGAERQRQGPGVREHVAGVGEQRDAAGDEAADDLEHGERRP